MSAENCSPFKWNSPKASQTNANTGNQMNGSRDTDSFAAVTLPNQLPPVPDLSDVPPRILHSRTVETLLAQNDDLMARLKVSLRRNAVIEGQLIEQERKHEETLHEQQALMSEIQVIREKDQMLREKVQRGEGRQTSLEGTIDSLRERLAKADHRIRGLEPAQRYQRRIERWVRPLVVKLQQDLMIERQTSLEKTALASDLQAKWNEEVRHARHLENQFMKDQTNLVEHYEAESAQTRTELTQLRSQVKLLSERAAIVESATEARAVAENKIITLERAFDDMALQMEICLDEADGFNSQLQAKEQEIQSLRAQVSQAMENESNLRDQFECTQKLWMDVQKKFENSVEQQDTLNRLNQELSRQLKESQTIQAPEMDC